jgi:uncharacterized protein (DUF488 family)
MIELGLLKTADDFQLSTKRSYLNELTPADKTALLKFKAQIGDLRGDKLVKKIYREFPQYTSRSKIAGRHFTADEINQLQFAWNTDTKPAVFSIGYEGLTIDSFLHKLIANNITVVVDVRNNPQSMKYGFSKKSFKQYIESAGLALSRVEGMKYIHIPELGIPSSMRKGLGERVSHKTLFKAYENKLLPNHETEIKQLIDLTPKMNELRWFALKPTTISATAHPLTEHLQKNKSFKPAIVHLCL